MLSATKCTFAKGSRGTEQKMYHCRTCGLVNELGCCEACAKICHAGHSLIPVRGTQYFNCDCGAECGKSPCKCSVGNKYCSNLKIGTNVSAQHVWCCKTCGMGEFEGICNVCAELCHKGHKLVDKGIWNSFTCSCGSKGTQCTCCERVTEKPRSPLINDRFKQTGLGSPRVTGSPLTQNRDISSPRVQNQRQSILTNSSESQAEEPAPTQTTTFKPHVTFYNLM